MIIKRIFILNKNISYYSYNANYEIKNYVYSAKFYLVTPINTYIIHIHWSLLYIQYSQRFFNVPVPYRTTLYRTSSKTRVYVSIPYRTKTFQYCTQCTTVVYMLVRQDMSTYTIVLELVRFGWYGTVRGTLKNRCEYCILKSKSMRY